ncbi:MAG: aminopeptidase N [Planctomycetaceae bacterium]|nr:aminopeptidase N [Planctomycetaceae bacterium]MBT6495542.1 aminopeptidase N [Planctomycetaceae bacterium]
MSAPIETFRSNYLPSDFEVEGIDLTFELGETETIVHTIINFVRTGPDDSTPLVLNGEELELRSLTIDDVAVPAERYAVVKETLTIEAVPSRFTLKSTVAIKPQENLALSGLYKSSGSFCTQCEAEGFRRITYFLDRPDVMTRYRTTIIADPEKYPVLLSNGNHVDTTDWNDGRRKVVWEDPFPKPSYLFALVAGNLKCNSGTFTTQSGREVQLEIWVAASDLDKTDHALVSLQKSMAWDEERFGLEYDLDIYMIVAVSDFNMGAMENKGLNIFNTKYVLAKSDTATDADFDGVEAVIAHEYFHNWTGNRVTCRDWFQLTLKEGLTVFRDQQFTMDQTSEGVKRIHDVQSLRYAQFPEDAGPMSHPIRPESYVVMDNFYTATVYNKGAEVIRMYQTLLGKEGFRNGMDLYFQRHDGQAVTCDDFRAAMAAANDRDLTQFERWYDQNGTPELSVEAVYDPTTQTYQLSLVQRSTASESHQPFHMPIRIALLGRAGGEIETTINGNTNTEHLIELTQASETHVFEGVGEPPVPSILRGFSAPVQLKFKRPRSDYAFLMAHDQDDFNRWEAGQTLAKELLLEQIAAVQQGEASHCDDLLLDAFGKLLADESLDGSFKALAMRLPPERELGMAMKTIDPDAIHHVRNAFVKQLAVKHRDALLALYNRLNIEVPYCFAKDDVQRRTLKNTCLGYLSVLENDAAIQELVLAQFEQANNMTDQQAALVMLTQSVRPERDKALENFYAQWQDDALVIDKWFAVQGASPADDCLECIEALANHPAFNLKNPNRLRALVGAFSGNQFHFHNKNGQGYRFLSEIVLQIQKANPQAAARMVSGFNQWKRFDTARQALMRAELERIIQTEDLARDVFEIVTRALN